MRLHFMYILVISVIGSETLFISPSPVPRINCHFHQFHQREMGKGICFLFTKRKGGKQITIETTLKPKTNSMTSRLSYAPFYSYSTSSSTCKRVILGSWPSSWATKGIIRNLANPLFERPCWWFRDYENRKIVLPLIGLLSKILLVVGNRKVILLKDSGAVYVRVL